MTVIADILMGAGALGAAFYCMVLSRRLRRFADLEKGVGGAVAVLSVQVDDMNRSIRQAQQAAAESAATLNDLTARAEDAARRLELMIASMHDLPAQTVPAASAPPSTETRAAEPQAAAPKPKSEPPLTAATPAPTIFSSRRKLGERVA